ncbi:MAG: hypothetical protein KQH57_20075 [Actinomycetales bacterium]|nr:hypothetical protein [Actinomycetales bacterium]
MPSRRRRRRKVRLTHDEILVLFELVHRWQDGSRPDAVPVAHPGEAEALRRLAALLAPEVDEVFGAHYAESVEAARTALAESARGH